MADAPVIIGVELVEMTFMHCRGLLCQLFVLLATTFLGTAASAAGEPVPTLDPKQVTTGQAVYGQHCASCHGANGEGAPDWRQSNAQGELPAPPHNPEGHTWRHSDADLYEMISKGWRDPINKTDRLTMR